MRILLLSLIILLSCVSCASNETSTDKSVQAQQTTTTEKKTLRLSDLSFTDLDGNTFSGEKFEGKPVFMNIWATWCGPCIKEMPSIQEAMQKVKGITFVFPSDEDLDQIKKFKDRKDFPFNFVQLNTSFIKLGVNSLPTTFMFNSKGEVIEAIIGAEDWNSKEALQYLQELSENK